MAIVLVGTAVYLLIARRRAERRSKEIADVLSDLKISQEALKITEERFRFAQAITKIAIFEYDVSTRTVQWSARLESSREACPDGNFSDWMRVVHPDHRERVSSELQRLVSAGGEYESEYPLLLSSGDSIWLYTKAACLKEDSGKPIRIVGASIDISRRRLLEEQLHQAQRLEGLGRLAAGVAHDFNNILLVISGYAELLSDLVSDDLGRRYLSDITAAARRGARLICQLTALGRKQDFLPDVLDLNQLIERQREILRRLIRSEISLRISCGENLGSIEADAGQIERVIMNLVINASDAMPQGGTLTISTAEIDGDKLLPALPGAGGRFIQLSVRDTGSGIEPEIQSKIFDPFFTTKKLGKGTGLGLAIVHSIVQQNRGYILLDSKVDVGSSFHILLPRSNRPVVHQSNLVARELNMAESS